MQEQVSIPKSDDALDCCCRRKNGVLTFHIPIKALKEKNGKK
jgi:hypothetical protein